MPPIIHVTYADIQSYLDAISDHPLRKRNVDESPHGRFWNMPHQKFTTGTVPDTEDNGTSIPIADKDPTLLPRLRWEGEVRLWRTADVVPPR
jgi:hypothetical protein